MKEDDAISRQAALDAFGVSEKTRKYGGDHSGYGTMMLYEIQQTLEDLPSVTPKQRTGHWIMSDDGLYRPICNNCGAHPWKGYIPTVEEATKAFKYCPTCGIKMVEPQESEEV